MRILLNKNRSKRSNNLDGFVPVDLGNKMKRIIGHSEQHTVDLYRVYLDERDASDKYRLIFTINPVCTNALFNALTEVVYNEGSDECICLKETDDPEMDGLKQNFPEIISEEPLTRPQAIRDTEYSAPEIMGLEYLPGIDIFNNHLLRQNGFNSVMKRTGADCKKDGVIYTLEYSDEGADFVKKADVKDVFNTIRDYQRTYDGKKVTKKFPGYDATYLSPVTGQPHLYRESDILDFESAFRTGLSEKDGWFGFYNHASLDCAVGKTEDNADLFLNKVLNNRNSCDFVEMFPDRKRYTFVPQKNKYRGNRLEKNWEYCLTYPYSQTEYLIDNLGQPLLDENDEPILNPLIAEEDSGGWIVNGLQFRVAGYNVTDGGKRRILLQSTGCIHNLRMGSVINLYYLADEDGVYSTDPEAQFSGKTDVTVTGLGDKSGNLSAYYFTIDEDDVPEGWFDENQELRDGIKGRFRKTVFGVECDYYFRIFRKVPNFKDIAKDEDRSYYIGKYNKSEYDFNSEINKLAFAGNIYGDNIVQIVYLDDVDVKGLTDNLGRDVSDIYLTIIKSNQGHDKWYPEDPETPQVCGDPEITIARAFGKVTSGINLPWNNGFEKDFNVHRIHNIKYDDLFEKYDGEFTQDVLENIGIDNYKEVETSSGKTMRTLFTLEDDIKPDREFFLGDLVEFSLPQYEELILEPVYHRFNTAQREYVDPRYKDIITDEIFMDDYEGSETGITENNSETFEDNFKCVEQCYNKGYREMDTGDRVPVLYPGNLFPEGYFYQPHYKIHLKDVSEKISQSSDLFVNVGDTGVTILDTGDEVEFVTDGDYDLAPGDGIIIQDSLNNIFYDGIVEYVEDVVNITARTANAVRINEFVEETPKRLLIFKKTLGIPKYAKHYPDTSGKYIWKALVPPSKTSTKSEIFDKPFANGAHYRHMGINFFLRRQDPYGDYHLNMKNETATGEVNKLTNFMTLGRFNGNIYDDYVTDFGIIDMC